MDKLPEWAKNILTPTFIDRVDLCGEGCNSAAFIKLIKEKGATKMEYQEVYNSLKDEAKAVVDAHIKKEKDMAASEAKAEADKKLKLKEAELANATQALELEKKKKCGVAKTEEEALAKALETADPIVKSMFETLQAQKKAAEEAAKFAKEKEQENIAKEKAEELKALGFDAKDLVNVCKSINTLDEAERDAIYAVLKSAASIKKVEDNTTSIYKAMGADGQPNTSIGATSTEGAWEAIEKAAESVMKEQKITKEAGIAVVIKEKPELYQAYLDSLE